MSTNRRFARLTLLATVVALSVACASTKPPSLRVQGLKFRGLGITGAGIDVSFMVRNTNPEPLRVERFEYELSLNGYRLGRGYHPEALLLGGFAEEKVLSRFDLNLLTLPGSVRRVLERDRVRARVKGKFYVRRADGTLRELGFKSKANVNLRH